MAQPPPWSQEEFDVLLASYGWTVAQTAQRLPQRSPGAIAMVQELVHAFHARGDAALLSRLMRARLQQPRAPLTCPHCGAQF